MTTVSLPHLDVPATPESLVEEHAQACAQCGRSTAVTGTVVSQHRTSQGTVVYTRCECGVLQMRLVRPDTGERLVAQGRVAAEGSAAGR